MTPRTMRLTTPPMKGADVRELQRLLSGDCSVWGNFQPGGVDGEFGALTGAAVFRAKYWLGYATPNRVAGPTLVKWLKATPADLPVAFRERRKARIDALKKAQASETFGERAVRIAKGEVGTAERPVNLQKYGEYWGENGVAWCGLFVCWVWKQAGADISRVKALLWDYVPQLHADAIANRGVFLVGRSNIRPGDAVGLYRDGHVEMFVKWIDKAAGTFRTYGGNTTAPGQSGSQSEGGHVADPIRNWSDVSFAARKAG